MLSITESVDVLVTAAPCPRVHAVHQLAAARPRPLHLAVTAPPCPRLGDREGAGLLVTLSTPGTEILQMVDDLK